MVVLTSTLELEVSQLSFKQAYLAYQRRRRKDNVRKRPEYRGPGGVTPLDE